MSSQRFGQAGTGAIEAGDQNIGYISAVYGPSGRWITFSALKAVLLIWAGVAIGSIGLKHGSVTGSVAGVLVMAALCFLLAFFAIAHIFTREVAISDSGITYSGGFGMTTRQLRRDQIAGWRMAREREFNFEELLSDTGVVTIYPADPKGKRISLAVNGWNFDEDFDHWLASLPRLIRDDALAGGDRWDTIVHDPMFAPLVAMVALVYGSIVILAALLVAKAV